MSWTRRPICTLCHGNGPFHHHHKRFRSHGGGDASTNLVLLCEVCHGAVHGLRVIKQGHSCRSCRQRRLWGCYFGEKVLDLPITTDPPWDIDQFGEDHAQ